MANEDRLKLFKAIGKAGYDIGNYEDFDRRMNNAEDRQKFYTAVSDAGFDIGPQEDFERRISPSKYRITVNGNDVQVSEKEYLDFLKRHPSGTTASPKPQQPQSQTKPQQASEPSTPSTVAPTVAEAPQDKTTGTPWGTAGSGTGQSRAYKPFAPGQKRTTDQPEGIGYNAPFRQDLTVAQHAEIEKMNDYTVRQLQKREDEEKRRSQPLVDTGSPEANKHIVRTQGEWEDDVQKGVNRITNSVVAPAVDKAIAEFDKRASEVFNKGRDNTNATGGLPTGSAGGFGILGNVRESNEAKDPEKILSYLQQQMDSLYKDSTFAEEVGKEADRMGIDRGEYIEKIIKPKIQQDLADRLTDTLVRRELPRSTTEYILNGLSNSIVGMLYNTVTESKGQRQIKNQAEAMTEEGRNPYYNPGTGAKLAQMGVSFAADAPFFGLYGKVSGQVAKNMAERQIQNLMAKGLSETAARSIVGTALENSVGARMKNYLMQQVVSSSLTMGGYNATSEAARQMRDSEFDPMRLAGSTAEGLATGAAFGVTGAVSQALSQPLTGISRVGAKAAGFAAEAETMYATEELAKMAQGEEGFTNPFEGSLEAMEKLGVMKASGGHLLTKAFETGADIYKNGVRQAIGKAMSPKQTGMKFTKEEEAYVRDTAEGRSLMETLGNMHPDAAFSEVNGKKKLTPEGEQMRRQLADNYNAFMGNTEIPAVVKQKVAGVLGGVYRPGLETGADIVHNADGSVIVKTRDKDGNCVRDLKFDTFSDAEHWREQCQDEFRLNDAVNMWNGTSQEQRAAVVREIAGINGISDKDAADLVHKALDAKDTSLDRDQYNNVYDVIARNAFPEDEYNPKRRFEEGRKITPEERHFALADTQVKEEQLALYGQEFADEVMAAAEYPDEKMAELAMRKDVTGPMLNAAKEYYNASARMQGMMEEALKGVDEQVEAANVEVRRNTHPDSGMLISGSSRGRDVYVTAGHFQITPEGKLASTDNSGAVIVRDMNTGEIDVINPNDVLVTGVTDPRRLIEANDSMEGLRGQLMKAADDSIEFAPGTPETPQEVGETFVGADGKTYMVSTISDENGNMTWAKTEVVPDENGYPAEILGEPQPFDIDEYRKAKSNEIDAANRPQEVQQPSTMSPESDQVSDQVTEGQRNGQIETPEMPANEIQQPESQQEGKGKKTEQQQPVSSRIPVDDKGKKVYEEATPEDTLAELTEKYGEEKANQMIAKIAESAARELDKLEQTNISSITDMADLEVHEDRLTEARKKAKYWQDLVTRKQEADARMAEAVVTHTANILKAKDLDQLEAAYQAAKAAGVPENALSEVYNAKKSWINLVNPKEIRNFATDPESQAKWVDEHIDEIVDSYIKTHGNVLDPDEMRNAFAGIGYDGKNVPDFREQEKRVVRAAYDKMLQNAVGSGNSSITLLTGVGGAGKSTATRNMDLSNRGLVYDSAFNDFKSLKRVIDRAKELGMTDIQVIAVYNDAYTAFSNTVNRGLNTGRFLALDYFVDAFHRNQGKIAQLRQEYPDVEIISFDNSGNKAAERPEGGRISADEAEKWDYVINDAKLNELLDILENGINEGRFTEDQAASIGRGLRDVTRRVGDIRPETVERVTRIGRRIRQEDVGDLRSGVSGEQRGSGRGDVVPPTDGEVQGSSEERPAEGDTGASGETPAAEAGTHEEAGNGRPDSRPVSGSSDNGPEPPAAGAAGSGTAIPATESGGTGGARTGLSADDGGAGSVTGGTSGEGSSGRGRGAEAKAGAGKQEISPAKKKVYQKTVEASRGRKFTVTLGNGNRSVITIDRIDHNGNVVLTRQDYDPQGNPIGEPRQERHPLEMVGGAIVESKWNKELTTEEKLRGKYKFKVGDVPVLDVLTESEQQQILDAIERGDKEAVGNLTGDFIQEHRNDIILRGRDQRNQRVEKAFARGSRAERLDGVRNQYNGFDNAKAMLDNDSMQPQSIEEYVADALGDVPKPGNGFLAYESYDQGGNTIVGMKDESGFGSRGFNGDTKGFNPWLAPKGKGKSLKQFAESVHESLPEGMKEQYSDQDIRDIIYNILTGAEKPTDIANYILRNRVKEAEAEARHEEDGWMEEPGYQKWVEKVGLTDMYEHKVEQGNPAFDSALQKLDQREISIDDPDLLKEYGLKNVTLSRLGDHVTLTHFVVDNQGQGNGTRFMEDLARLADEKGWTLDLTPDTSFGATSIKRLKNFYKRFGFKDNKGRNTDFFTRESMVRRPKDWQPMSPEQQEKVLRDAVVDHLRQAGIEVSTDWKEGQRILDDYNSRMAVEDPEAVVKPQKTDEPMLFKTKDGHAYGYTYKGKIYLDPRIAMSETPVHEYGHLWAEMKRQTSPEEWDDIKRVMLTDKLVQPIIERVKRDYPELSKEGREDDFVEEVITQFSGKRGAERLREIANEIAAENGGVFGKAEAVTAMQRLKNILNRFWEGVAKMMGWKYRNANQIADRILADMLNDVDPTEKIKAEKLEMKPQKEDTAARDKEYADAVAAGDKEKVDAMLREEAARKSYDENSDYQGTTAFNGSAPSKNDYFDTKEERKEAFENGNYDGTASLGDFMDSGIDLGNLDWTIHDWRGYHTASSAGKESIMNLRNTVDGKKKTITMYRSVPSSVKENSFRNGDWVTPSLQYAKDNAAVHGWGRKYRIIEQEVPVDDIWWDNNDINEWGYDDGKGYAYKNTRNNRKLMEPTYDDKGNLIPLSKRFNDRNADIRFQMVGKKGAAEADKADQSPQRTEDMNLAEEMEKAGKDTKAIKMATGWERGADGQWRYEIPDTDADILSKYNKKLEEAKARGIKEPTVITNLEDLLGKDSELFKYYPNLRKMAVMFSNYLPDGTSGLYDGANIELNAKEARRFEGEDLNNENIYGTLLHEIQHAVQDIEGFAKGGSMQTATTKEGIEAIVSKKTEEKERILQEIEAERKILSSEEELDLAAQLDNRTMEDERKHINDEIDELAQTYDNLTAQIDRIREKGVVSMTDAKDLYHRLAGEVESRNVTERMDMTLEERRNSLASDTEDVKREDQVVIMDDGTSDSSGNSSPIGKTSSPEAVQAEESRVNTSPTDAQKEAGNYQKGHINVDGYDITIENPKGSVRSGVDSKGNRWESTMHNTYGYIRGTEGVDGDHIDVFLSDNPASGNVYVIDQVNPDTGEFDEHKIVYGYATEEEARQAYLSNYGEGWKGLGNITEVSREAFRQWIKSSHHKTKPFSEYKSVKANEPKFQRAGSPEPEMTPEERQYWNKWDADMRKWRERNAIDDTATGPSEKPKMQQGESALDYAKRLVQWNREKSLWQTAPKLEDYRQRREDKDVLEAARENEQRYPDSPSAKMRRVAAEFQQIRRAMSQQKAYDKATVKAVTDFAQEFMRMGFGDNLSRGEMERMLSSVKNATGAKDIKREIDNIMNILVDNQLRNLDQRVTKLSSVKELSKTAQSVEKQGRLELKGQRMIQAFRQAREGRMDAARIRERMNEVAEKMARNDEEAPMWEQEYEGLSIALQYQENIEASRDEYADLDRAYKAAVENYKGSGRSYKAQQELLEAIDQAMAENKIERIGLFGDIIGRLEGNINESMKGARDFVERDKERVKHIQQIANFDLAGKPADAMREKQKGKPANFFLQPLATFEQMLRQFGSRSAKGEGHLYDYFMRNWIDSVDRSYVNEQKAKEELDAKAREVFGNKVKRWSDLYELERSLPTMEVKVFDGENPRTFTLNQGNLLYIYMADKMADGRMKLRNMGIEEADVEAIRDFLDPRLKQLGDWLQDEYLPGKRTEYNKVHERMFGAPMAAIDNYFPLRILGDARYQEADVNVPDAETLPSTITGNIIKRTKNTLPLDILHTDALSLAIEHVEDMERWAATAEWNRDVNTLLSYTTFRNKVKNMDTIYGSGDALWEAFKNTAKMAAGTYSPSAKSGGVDKAISNIAKGVTAAKINFRVYTAFKQILSAPAFLHDVNLGDFVKNSINPYGSWKWAMENMPVFRKRWKSRQVGDTRLMDDPTDWKMWKTNIVQMATRLGMSPNALVDGVTCAVGARSIYEARYKQYKDIGASDEVARKRALQDAEIGYNLTQQSSEGAFVSAIQKDRTVAANMLSVFRNSSMAYTRQWVDAARNLRHRAQKGYKEDSIKFMTRQMQDQFGLEEDEARKAAEKEYARAARHDVARLLNMMFGVTTAWNIGASLPYLLMGDDDETKKEMLTDAAVRAMIAGPTEGLAAGNLFSEFISRTAASEETRKTIRKEGWGAGIDAALKQGGDYEVNPLPLMADIQGMIKKMGYDKYAAAQDVFNICMQSAVGVNPQTFTDMWNACMDYGNPDWMPFTKDVGNDDLANSKEIALFIMRLMNAPTSSWRNKYIDELGMNVEDARKLPYEEMARRYANYKHWKDAPVMGWLRGDAKRQEKMEKIQKQFDDAVVERMERLTDKELMNNLARSESAEEKRRYAKIIAQRMGLAPVDALTEKQDLDKNWYQHMYQERMLYDDIREEEMLDAKLKDYREKYAGDNTKSEVKKRLDWIRNGKYDTPSGRKGNRKKGNEPDLLAPGKKQFSSDGDEKANEAIMKNIRKWRKEALEILMRAEVDK